MNASTNHESNNVVNSDSIGERVVLISRLTTQNAGNEALSVEFINFINGLLPKSEVRAMDRYPQYLYALKMRQLGNCETTIIANFEQYVRRLDKSFKDADKLAPLATEALVKLNLSGKELPRMVARVKRWIGVRRKLARFGLVGRESMACYAATCRWAETLIWNPAGEIHPTGSSDEVLRLLVLVRLAQLNGAKTYIVNHSLEIADEKLRYLIKHVYINADYVVLRDKQSCREAKMLGVKEGRIREIPDMVFLSAETDVKVSPPPVEAFPKGAIGLAINGLEANNGHDEWDELMSGLKAFNLPVVFLSNAMNHDLDFACKLADKHELTVVKRQPTYREIRGFYCDLGVLISSRLHSSIIALSEDVPVMTIEPSTFKLTGIFDQLGYPVKTLRLEKPGWAKRTLANVDRALSDTRLRSLGRESCLAKCNDIRTEYYAILNGVVSKQQRCVVNEVSSLP